MPKSIHKRKKKKRYYKPKYHEFPDIYALPNVRDNRLTPEIKKRALSKSAFSYEDSIVLWDAIPEKMSEILMDYADPLLIKDPTESDLPIMEKALNIALMIWNYAIFRDLNVTRQVSLLDRLKTVLIIKIYLNVIGKGGYYSSMMKRKRTLYPDNNRILTGVDVSWNSDSDEPYVVVISTLDERLTGK